MLPSRLSRNLTQQTSTDGLRLPFLYRTKTILATATNDDCTEGESARPKELHRTEKRGKSMILDSPTRTRRGVNPQHDGYRGRHAYSYSRGAASHFHEAPKTGHRGRVIPSLQSSEKLADRERKQRISVPFEKADDPYERHKHTTMTEKEFKTFKKLFRDGMAAGTNPDKSTRVPGGDIKSSGQSRSMVHPKPEFPDLLRPLAEEAALLRAQTRSEFVTFAEQKVQAVKSDERSAAYLAEVQDMMTKAKFDTELWQVLEDHVFAKIKALRLRDDGVDARIQAALTQEKLRDFQLLTDTLPAILLHYIKSLQSSFPGSPLGLTLLPALKKMGSSAFTLGATTDLFNQHIQLLFRHYTDLDGICKTLSEMESEVYEFNYGTKKLLDKIFTHANASRLGTNGAGIQALWLTDRKARALVKLNRWKEIVDERVAANAMKEARARAAELAGDPIA